MKMNSSKFLCAAVVVLFLSSFALAIELTPLLPPDGSEITQPQVVAAQCIDFGQTAPGGPCTCTSKVNNGNPSSLPYVENSFGYYESGPYFIGNGFAYGNNDVHVDCSKGADSASADWSFSAKYNPGESVSSVTVQAIVPEDGSSKYSPVYFKSTCVVSGTSLNPNANNMCNCRVRYRKTTEAPESSKYLFLGSIGNGEYDGDSELEAGDYKASFICNYGDKVGWNVV